MLGHIWWTFQTLFWDWRLTRPRDHLLLKILMVLLIPSGVTLLALSYQMDRRRVRVNYLLAAREAIRNEKLEQAELYFRKAAYLNPNVDEAALDYWHAILAERQNDLDRARRLMFRLLIRRGTPQTIQVGAHIWMCEDVLRMEKLSQKEFEQLAQHLRIILGLVERLPKQGEPLTATTRGLGMISEAISHVCLRLPRMFQMNLQTARYFAANGDVTFAKQLIESSIGILQRFAKEEPASVE